MEKLLPSLDKARQSMGHLLGARMGQNKQEERGSKNVHFSHGEGVADFYHMWGSNMAWSGKWCSNMSREIMA